MGVTGEMHYTPKSSDSHVSFPRDNTTGVAYVAQEAWILQGTVRVSIDSNIGVQIYSPSSPRAGQHRVRFSIRREAV